MSAPVLHDSQCEAEGGVGTNAIGWSCRCEVRAVTAERDAALAEVARMRPVVEAALAMKDCRDHAGWVSVAPRRINDDCAAVARRADNLRVLDKLYSAVQVYREQVAKAVQP